MPVVSLYMPENCYPSQASVVGEGRRENWAGPRARGQRQSRRRWSPSDHPTQQTASSIASFQSFLEHTWAVRAEFRGEEERREERKVRSSEDKKSPVTQLPSVPQWRARVL